MPLMMARIEIKHERIGMFVVAALSAAVAAERASMAQKSRGALRMWLPTSRECATRLGVNLFGRLLECWDNRLRFASLGERISAS